MQKRYYGRIKVLKNQENVKNRTVQIKYKEDLRGKNQVRDQISLKNDRKEEYNTTKAHTKNHPKTIVILKHNARKKVFNISIRK